MVPSFQLGFGGVLILNIKEWCGIGYFSSTCNKVHCFAIFCARPLTRSTTTAICISCFNGAWKFEQKGIFFIHPHHRQSLTRPKRKKTKHPATEATCALKFIPSCANSCMILDQESKKREKLICLTAHDT